MLSRKLDNDLRLRMSRCIEPPIGCGKSLKDIPFRDPSSASEYDITGMCQACQDEHYTYLRQLEEHQDCSSKQCVSHHSGCPMEPYQVETVFPYLDNEEMAPNLELIRDLDLLMSTSYSVRHGDRRLREAVAPGVEEVHGRDEGRQGHPDGEQPEVDPVA